MNLSVYELASGWQTAWGEDNKQATTTGSELVKRPVGEPVRRSRWMQLQEGTTSNTH